MGILRLLIAVMLFLLTLGPTTTEAAATTDGPPAWTHTGIGTTDGPAATARSGTILVVSESQFVVTINTATPPASSLPVELAAATTSNTSGGSFSLATEWGFSSIADHHVSATKGGKAHRAELVGRGGHFAFFGASNY